MELSYVLISLTLILAIAGKWKDFKKDGKANWNTILIVGLTILFASLAMLNQHKTDLKAKAKQDSLKANNDYLTNLVSETNKKIQIVSDSLNKQKSDLERDNFRLSQELTERTFDLKQNILGSYGPAYIDFQTSYDQGGDLIFINISELTIYRVAVYISNFEEMMSCKQSPRKDMFIIDEPCYKKCTKILNYENIQPGNSRSKDYSLPATATHGKLEIRFLFNSGVQYLEQLVYKKENGRIITKGRLLKLKGSKYKLLKEIGDAKVNWSVDFDKEFPIPLTVRAYLPITWR